MKLNRIIRLLQGGRSSQAILVLVLVVTLWCGVTKSDANQIGAEDLTVTNDELQQVAARARKWLLSQSDETTNLLDSYEDEQDIAYIYDQAVAAIALLSMGNIQEAEKILNALKDLQLDDPDPNKGGWCTATRASEGTCLQFLNPVGPTLWVTLAVARYREVTGEDTYNQMAKNALDYTLQFQSADGGINLGSGQTGASTEHNEDAYAALSYFHNVFPTAGYDTEAAEVKSFLDTVVWHTYEQRFEVGRGDGRDPVDVNSWGVLALGAGGGDEPNYANSLDYVERVHRLTIDFKGMDVTGYDFDGQHSGAQSEPNDIWLEGTAQIAAAYKFLGNTRKSDEIIEEILKVQGNNGGVPYSLRGTNNGYFNMKTEHSVAATSWLILAINGVNPVTAQ
ncbi:MAG: hypothetical protein AB4426_29615 [Xenococcaceae cyanobacterium]